MIIFEAGIYYKKENKEMKPFVTKLLYTLGVTVVCGQLQAQSLDQAKKLYNEGQYAEAKPAFEKLVKQSPSNSSYNLWYGVCCYETGDLAAAEKSLSFAVKRRVIEAYRYLGEVYFKTYRFEDAVDMYEQYIEWLEKKKRETEAAELRLDILQDAKRMMDKVENIQIIDSMVVDKDDFFSAYTLSEESGRLMSYESFFKKPGVSSSVYMNQKGDKVYYAHPTDENHYCLYTQSRLLDQWGDEKQLPMNINSTADDNYPFVLPDGVTLYYASQGNDALGGYDLFVTRYNMNSDSYLAPERLGMPFNSPYNDYMIVFDEVKGLGWFVSDRFQPEGQVCVYLFIPNENHDRVETEDVEVKRSRAAVRSIRDSWVAGEDYSKLIQLAHQEIPYGKKEIEKDFDFVVQDNRIYYTWDQIKSPEAKSIYQKVVSLKQQIASDEKKLDALRLEYSKNPGKREQLKTRILDLEAKLEAAVPQVRELEKQARNAEVRYLKK